MKAVDTPIGKAVVLPPCDCEWNQSDDALIAQYGLGCIHESTAGDTVDVEEDCPTCEGKRIVWGDMGYACPCSTGIVSVPHVVTEVLPVVADGYAEVGSYIEAVDGGEFVLWTWDEALDDHTSRFLFDREGWALPGGVVLVVERVA